VVLAMMTTTAWADDDDKPASPPAELAYAPRCEAPPPAGKPSKWDGNYRPRGRFLHPEKLCPTQAMAVPEPGTTGIFTVPPITVSGGQLLHAWRVYNPVWAQEDSRGVKMCGDGMDRPICNDLAATNGSPRLDLCTLALKVKPNGVVSETTFDRAPIPKALLAKLASDNPDAQVFANLNGIKVSGRFVMNNDMSPGGMGKGRAVVIKIVPPAGEQFACSFELLAEDYQSAPRTSHQICVDKCRRQYAWAPQPHSFCEGVCDQR
jgi:hypothetical protein